MVHFQQQVHLSTVQRNLLLTHSLWAVAKRLTVLQSTRTGSVVIVIITKLIHIEVLFIPSQYGLRFLRGFL